MARVRRAGGARRGGKNARLSRRSPGEDGGDAEAEATMTAANRLMTITRGPRTFEPGTAAWGNAVEKHRPTALCLSAMACEPNVPGYGAPFRNRVPSAASEWVRAAPPCDHCRNTSHLYSLPNCVGDTGGGVQCARSRCNLAG